MKRDTANATAKKPSDAASSGPFTLPPLPFAENALEPVISARTMSFHYGKHHKNYVETLNKLVRGTRYEAMPLMQVISVAAAGSGEKEIFNNAGQAWNHTFFWNSLKGRGGGQPPSELARRIDESFDSFDAFKKALAQAAVKQFGSGWAWLVADEGGLKVMSTANAEVPFTSGLTPLLTLDVWEHAYYLDYQNKRVDYAEAVIDKLLNWEFALENLMRR